MKQAIVGGTLLTVALGGPYFVFETEAGKQLQTYVGLRESPGQAEPQPQSPEQDASIASFFGWGVSQDTQSAASQANASAVDSGISPGWLTSTTSSQQPQSYAPSPPTWSGTPTVPPPSQVPSTARPVDPNQFRYEMPKLPEIPDSGMYTQRIQALQEVLRFDISPAWVLQRFPQVATVTADTRLDGMRVMLMTGTMPNDLAGTLTYYFDHYKRVQRITIHATTGDPARFLAELQHVYRLQQQPALRGNLYVRKWNGRPTSLAYTELAPFVSAHNANSKFKFYAELNSPGLEFGISSEAKQIVDTAQPDQRW